jgi:hypothetical protein
MRTCILVLYRQRESCGARYIHMRECRCDPSRSVSIFQPSCGGVAAAAADPSTCTPTSRPARPRAAACARRPWPSA